MKSPVFKLKSFLPLILGICLLAMVSSCSDDDDEDSGPAYEFQDQNLQGMIDGNSWQLASGFSRLSSFTAGDLDIEMSNQSYDDVCAEFFLDGLQVFFDVPAEVGIYELSFSEDGESLTLFNPENSLNIIVVEGAIEITSVTNTQVTGKIDGRSDDENYINGNFTVTVCEK